VAPGFPYRLKNAPYVAIGMVVIPN
jgi:hypothetical protein